MFNARYFNPRYWAARFWTKVGATPEVICNTGFVGNIKAGDIGFQGNIDGSDIGFVGLITDAIGFIGNIEPIILVSPQANVTQATLIGGIITLSVTGDPIGIGFQGAIDGSDFGLVSTIDDSNIGFVGTICGC